jgi:hypothetical protein
MTVGNKADFLSVTNIRDVFGGGSSKIFNNAFADSPIPSDNK